MKTSKIIFYTIPLLILAVPFFGMQFAKEIDWDIWDFTIMGILLYSTAFVADFIWHKKILFTKKLLFLGILIFVLAIIWAELAVGIFGSPFAGS